MAERELEELFRAWRAEPVPPSLPPGVDDRAGSAVVAAALRRVTEQKQRQRRQHRLAAGFALAAAVTGLGVGAWYELGGGGSRLAGEGSSVSVSAPEGEVAVTDDVGHVVQAVPELTEGYGVRTEQGSATLRFASGASARVAHKSSLKITRARDNEALFLARGSVDVEVPKLDPARGFSVETPDARVTVHGTRFGVFVEPGLEGPHTRVAVTHGIVSVQQGGREVFLTAGQTWPPAAVPGARLPEAMTPEAPTSEAMTPEAMTPEAMTTEATPEGASQPAGGDADLAEEEEGEDSFGGNPIDDKKQEASPRGKPRKFDSRELADQNQRFARAMSLKKSGDAAAALRELGLILRRYPGSPLTQEARVERLRLLRGLGRTELARREAKRYLREFPKGYAVPEAEELLSSQP